MCGIIIIMDRLQYDGPVALVILDGVGLALDGPGNAVAKARTPFLGHTISKYPHIALEASGEKVGLLPGTMGNSEVGHNTIGCGQIIKHGIAHIEEAFLNESIWQSAAWQTLIKRLQDNHGTLHFAGIFSDGGVHSHIDHLERMVGQAYKEGIRKMRVHCVFDGRDVAPQSEPKYIERFEKYAKQFENADIKIASGGGRMTTIADRYNNDPSMVERGFAMMVHGESSNHFSSATEAISSFRTKDSSIQDQYLPDFVIVDTDSAPIGKIQDGDVLIYLDFRADRAVEIAETFENYSSGDILFVGMTEYDTDRHLPKNRLVEPNYIASTLHEFLAQQNIRQLAISETAKFGHITYYFDGNSYDKLPLEDFVEITSDTEPFDTRPWMKSAEITDAILSALDNQQQLPKFVRVNYPGGDMVGHFANINSTVIAMEAIDLQLARLAKKIDELKGCLIITADHGNAEELFDEVGQPKTSHSMNKVPFVIYDNTSNHNKYQLKNLQDPGLSNIAATIATLMGAEFYPKEWDEPLITVL